MIRRLMTLSSTIVVFALALTATRLAMAGDLADAMMNGDTASVQTLLAEGADVNDAQLNGSTALHWAVYRMDVDATGMLIESGADVSVATREGITPLYLASLYGNPTIIGALIEAGADAAARGPNGETMLMLAARNGNPEAVQLLIDSGVDVNAFETIRGTTALMWSIEQGNAEAVALLIDAGADLSAMSARAGNPRPYMSNAVNTARVREAQERIRREQLGLPPLESAEGRGGFRAGNGGFGGGRQAGQIPQALLDRLTEVGGPDAAQTLQDLIASGQDPQEVIQQAAEALGFDLTAGFGGGGFGGPDQDDDEGEADGPVAGLAGGDGGGLTPLVFAAREGDLESTRLLIEAGADVNQTTYFGWTPLLTATNNRNYQIGRMLIEAGADVNMANGEAMTPLYLATDNRNIEGGDYPVPKPDMDHLEFIELLLESGADPNHRVEADTLTRTIFTMQWLKEAGATAFLRASQSSDTELMRLLLAYGADPMMRSDIGDTALTASAGIGWVDGVTFERSPEENVEAVQMLLDLGLDPNAANNDGRTPLMAAAFKGNIDVVRLLLSAGARLETRDNGSRDTDKSGSKLAGHTWQALDYAEGLVRVGVQSAPNHPDVAAVIRQAMAEQGLPVPDINRTVDSICIVAICMGELVDEILGLSPPDQTPQ